MSFESAPVVEQEIDAEEIMKDPEKVKKLQALVDMARSADESSLVQAEQDGGIKFGLNFSIGADVFRTISETVKAFADVEKSQADLLKEVIKKIPPEVLLAFLAY